MHDLERTLAGRIRVARQQARLTLGQLADFVDVSSRTLIRYEGGESKPKQSTLSKIAEATGTSVSWLEVGSVAPEELSEDDGLALHDMLQWKRDEGARVKAFARHEVFQEIVRHFSKYRIVEHRLRECTAQKVALARGFKDLYGLDIKHQKYRKIFFESGSTPIYLAMHIAEHLPTEFDPPSVTISTPEATTLSGTDVTPEVLSNNAITDVYLWLCKGVLCERAPRGMPDDKYAGLYGPFTNYSRQPAYDRRPFSETDPAAAELIAGVSEKMFDRPEKNKKTLILAAMSGAQLSEEVDAVYAENDKPVTDKHVLEKLQRCGFHVGSLCNKCIKLSLYAADAPTIFFIHDEKIDSTIRVGECHIIFDDGNPWEHFIETHPMSLWVSSTRASLSQTRDKCKEYFTKGDWYWTVYGAVGPYPIVIGHNQEFRKRCKEDIKVKPIA